jgi:meso-butanediol dehydrogenase/(S,S)-butanediol dehydrogenase/diacetyl reductase
MVRREQIMNSIGLEGKIAIITGAASGMGRATARALTEAGACTVIADWNYDAALELSKELPDSLAARVDVADEAAVEQMVSATMERYGVIDILINNAGICYNGTGIYKMNRVIDSTRENWDAVIGVNLTGVALCCKHVLPIMDRQGHGVIVNNASMNALVGFKGADAYSAAKGGVVALTRALAIDWGPRNIRVNCICPGAILTPMSEPFSRTPEECAAQEANIPLGYIGAAEDVAPVIVFLASDWARYVHGAIIPVDGGWVAR